MEEAVTFSRHEAILADHVYLKPPRQNRSINSRNLEDREGGRQGGAEREGEKDGWVGGMSFSVQERHVCERIGSIVKDPLF